MSAEPMLTCHDFKTFTDAVGCFKVSHKSCKHGQYILLSAHLLYVMCLKNGQFSFFEQNGRVIYEPDVFGNLIKKSLPFQPKRFMGTDVVIGEPPGDSFVLGCYGCGKAQVAKMKLEEDVKR